MQTFLQNWGEAAYTSAGFFWMSVWAFMLGYLISSFIQVFVTEKRMQSAMGQKESKGVLLGSLFGFISSSCSFAALASTKSLFKKGASFVSSIAFLLASTNLVIELGIIISIFLGWQFVVGEYAGGVLLILISWLLIKIIKPKKLIEEARKNLGEVDEDNNNSKTSFSEKVQSEENWAKVAKQFGMEWKMVWKDVTVGFTIAGIVAAFVPDSFFQTLFINTGGENTDYGFFTILEHIVIGPVVAFITFIGSMGNIPLAALLFGKGVSFAGVIAFIFSDLVVFPVLRINAKYYGWKMALFIMLLLFVSLIGASLVLYYGFEAFQLLPDPSQVTISSQEFFKVNYTLFLNIGFILLSGYLFYLAHVKYKDMMYMKEMAPKSKVLEQVLRYAAIVCYVWLIGGLVVKVFINS
ncbi:permease [Neptunitalea lumnitzerae]|uniref:Membrane protein n=1 Tax=Neptunitalea lumnitzerae TaxID=2965509 RepID=A0ABQ5MPL5_9FLAO|nr:permease [Neptunitalea sp. Y10]GLB50922.1 membrane protein [Neptunitalea sp. Y10]